MLAIPGQAPPLALRHGDIVQQRLEQAAAAKDRSADEAAQSLRRTRTERNGERLLAAKQRVDAVRQQLKQLLMLGANPQQLALLAKELTAAVKAYAAAGGKPDAGPEAAARNQSQAADTPASEDASSSANVARENPYRLAATAIAAEAQRLAQRQAQDGAEREADQQVLGMARKLAEMIKAAARPDAAPAERRALKDALTDVDREIEDAESALEATRAVSVRL